MSGIRKNFLPVIIVIILYLSACASPNTNQDNNAASNDNQAATQEDTPEEADYPAKEICIELGNLLGQNLALIYEVWPKTFSELANGINGDGCQLAVGSSGDMISDWGDKNNKFVEEMFAAGWEVDANYSAATAGGELMTIRKGEYVCMYLSEGLPRDASQCSGAEPLSTCLERLAPADIIYEAAISCTPDNYVAEEDSPEPIDDGGVTRISLDESGTSAYVDGRLEAASMDSYVLEAMEGQELVISLNNAPPHQGYIEIIGEDGTVLISDDVEAIFFSGILETSQDYFINVLSAPEYALSYGMRVIIPPMGETVTGMFQPLEQTQCEELADLVGTISGVEAQIGTALFFDYIAQGGGAGCKVSSWGTFDMFPNREATSALMTSALASTNWTEASAYASGGAGGFGTGFTKDTDLCLYYELVHEVDPWACDGYDGPISECWADLDETEMYFEIQLTCAGLQ